MALQISFIFKEAGSWPARFASDDGNNLFPLPAFEVPVLRILSQVPAAGIDPKVLRCAIRAPSLQTVALQMWSVGIATV